jgi:GT2 family glycosyltransferase
MTDCLASIVIVNWNGRKYLEPLFESLARQTLPRESFEVILVDNASTDDSVAFVQQRYPWVQVIAHSRNDGFAGGNNVGIRRSRGRYLVLLNNDTEPDPSWLSILIEVAERTQAGAVVPKLLYKHRPGIINNAGSELKPDSYIFPVIEIGYDEPDKGQYDTEREVTAFCGASVILRRTMLEAIGLFDETLFMYWEDVDLSWRGQRAGYKYLYTPHAVVLHVHTGTSTLHSPLFKFFLWRNRVLILVKNASVLVALLGVCFGVAAPLGGSLYGLVRSLVTRSDVKRAIVTLAVAVKVVLSLGWTAPIALARRWKLIGEARFANRPRSGLQTGSHPQ